MTLREDIAALRKLVEHFAPRPERASGLRLLDFHDKAIAALDEMLNNEECSCLKIGEHPCPRCVLSIDEAQAVLALLDKEID